MNAQRPRTGPPRRLDGGMTLIELLAVLAILAILFGVGVPGMSRLVGGSRASASMMELHALLSHARQHAVTTQQTVTLCGTANGSACAKLWDGKPTLVFLDANLNRRADADERILAYSELTRTGSIRWSASGGRSYLRYRSDGRAAEYGSFTYCPANGDARHARQIILSATGRPRTAVDTDGDGIVEGRDGRPLSCP